MKIINDIKNSVFGVDYYKSIPTTESLGSSIKYLLKLSLILSLVSTIIFSVYIPGLHKKVNGIIDSLVSIYPSDLVITLKDGTASVNKPEPYTLPFPSNIFPQNNNTPYKNIFTIDTTKPFSYPQFNSYSSLVWITKTEIVTNRSNSQIQILPLAKLPNMVITKGWITEKESWVVKIIPKIIPWLIILMYVFYFMATFVGSLLCLFLYSIIVWLIAKIKKVKLSYKDSYKISLHALTLILIIESLNGLFKIPHMTIINIVIFVIIVYMNFFKENNTATSTEKVV